MRIRTLALAAILAATALSPAAAQRRQPSPEERIERLEKQVNQVQKRVFGRQPVDTAGYTLDPAVTQSDLTTLNSRLDSIERQMADIVRTSEENSNRVATLEAEVFRMKAEAEQRENAAPPPVDGADPADLAGPGADEGGNGPPPPPRPKYEAAANDEPAAAGPVAIAPGSPDFVAAGEEAYDRGYQLWTQKKYDQAISALRAMASSFPGHRRVSWAYNLAGRALLDKGQYRAAAEALLANYRRDPQGERAADSLFYLGQASLKLGQPAQACKAYAELENVYGSTMRSALRAELPAAKQAAGCR